MANGAQISNVPDADQELTGDELASYQQEARNVIESAFNLLDTESPRLMRIHERKLVRAAFHKLLGKTTPMLEMEAEIEGVTVNVLADRILAAANREDQWELKRRQAVKDVLASTTRLNIINALLRNGIPLPPAARLTQGAIN